jgi:RNA polymerase primary sigma factor
MLSGGQDSFDRYKHEVQRLSLLSAKDEVALARDIERLVLAHWCTLLSYPPARDVVAAAIRNMHDVPEPLAGQAQRIARSKAVDAAAIAKRLRPLDKDSAALMAADAAVQEAFGETPRAQPYLARVARARAAQLEAKGRFVASNLRLVIALARRYDGNMMSMADLIQEGNLGLIRAVERFDHRRGFRFSTYASWWIRHALNRGLSDKGRMVRVPVHTLDDVARMKRAIAASEGATGGMPSMQTLSAETGMSEEKLTLLRTQDRAGGYPLSLDKSLGDDREQTLHDVLPANDAADLDHAIDLSHWREELDELLSGLSSIEATTLRLRFGFDGNDEHTLSDIGDRYNLSRERIRQIQEVALGKLRDAVRRRRRPHDRGSLAA